MLARWMKKLLQYDIEFQVTRTIKGQGLAKLLANELEDVNLINLIYAIDPNTLYHIKNSWYANIGHYLQTSNFSINFSKLQKRSFK